MAFAESGDEGKKAVLDIASIVSSAVGEILSMRIDFVFGGNWSYRKVVWLVRRDCCELLVINCVSRARPRQK